MRQRIVYPRETLLFQEALWKTIQVLGCGIRELVDVLENGKTCEEVGQGHGFVASVQGHQVLRAAVRGQSLEVLCDQEIARGVARVDHVDSQLLAEPADVEVVSQVIERYVGREHVPDSQLGRFFPEVKERHRPSASPQGIGKEDGKRLASSSNQPV